jgi:hypothetical protein
MPIKPGPVKPKPSKGKNPKLPYRPADPGFFDKRKKAPIGPGKPVGPTPKKRKPGEGERRDPGFGFKKPGPGYKPGMPKKPTPVKPKPKGGSIRDLLYRVKPGEKLQKGTGNSAKQYKTMTSLNNNKMYKTGEVNPSKLNDQKIRAKDIFPMKPKLNDMMSRKPGRITKPVMPRKPGGR